MASRSRTRSRSHSRSPSRDNYRSRSQSRSRNSYRSRSPTPRRQSRSPSPDRRSYRSPPRNGRAREQSRSASRSASPPPTRGTKIVVERLTKNVNDDHLWEIFGQYGRIADLDLPVNRNSGTNRGTAYILYHDEAHAEAAIAHMHEAKIDGTAVNVSIVLPRRKLSPSPPTARRGANFDPRQPPPFNPRRRRQSPARYSGRANNYRPRSASRSRSPAPAPARRYRSRSPSHSRSPSYSPPRGGRKRESADHSRRRSPSRDEYQSRREHEWR